MCMCVVLTLLHTKSTLAEPAFNGGKMDGENTLNINYNTNGKCCMHGHLEQTCLRYAMAFGRNEQSTDEGISDGQGVV